MSRTIYFFTKFSDEYEFLKHRLAYYNVVMQNYDLDIHHFTIVENYYWSGTKNNVDFKYLDQLSCKYSNFNYVFIEHDYQHINSLSRRCREELANCLLSSQSQHPKLSENAVFIFSDLDEIASDTSLLALSSNLLSIPEYHIKNPIFLEQYSIWFSTNTIFDEKWRGPVAFLAKPPTSYSTLVQSTRHLPDKRTYVIRNSGVHISYLKSTINSKMHNSHGLRYLKIRIFLALIGIHPFRRKTPKTLKYTEDIKRIIRQFRSLSFTYGDLFGL